MPCYDPETHDRPIRLQGKVNRLTRLLCGLCRRSTEEAIAADPDLLGWWAAHQAHDEHVRKIKEKKEAGEPLTDEEKTILRHSEKPYD